MIILGDSPCPYARARVLLLKDSLTLKGMRIVPDSLIPGKY